MKWQCRVCMYVHEGEKPPQECPVCGAEAGDFCESDEDD